ncbi:membrane-bound ClpP family serine protease [Jeotgalibacillus terrae]|nr:hypothetical protein [Jeotgalibacillus terrae]MBM7580821.1 membrane-bound ClpP family serine protease [Jeotgalibacillus terrae]
MKKRSIWSIVFIVLGLLSFRINWLIEGFFEPIALIGTVFLLLGVVVSFFAIFKQEKGNMKFISLASFFIILFLITWFKTFEIVLIMTWLKNVT